MKRLFCLTIFLFTVDNSFGQTLTKEQKEAYRDSALFTIFSLPIVDMKITGTVTGPNDSILPSIVEYPGNYGILKLTKDNRVEKRGYSWDGKNVWDGQEYFFNKEKKIYNIKYYRDGKLVKDSILKTPIPPAYFQTNERKK